MRIGHGFDVHKLVHNRRLIIGGVEVPFDKGLLGHSDADVLSHAIGDALLGAATFGDLGRHFPDSSPELAGISSLLLLKNIAAMLAQSHFTILNVDATLIMQKPKVVKFIPQMRENIANAIGVVSDRVSIKATTTEGLGFTGRGDGIAAHAVALIDRKNDDEKT